MLSEYFISPVIDVGKSDNFTLTAIENFIPYLFGQILIGCFNIKLKMVSQRI